MIIVIYGYIWLDDYSCICMLLNWLKRLNIFIYVFIKIVSCGVRDFDLGFNEC